MARIQNTITTKGRLELEAQELSFITGENTNGTTALEDCLAVS
jgi:hypothetical protein